MSEPQTNWVNEEDPVKARLKYILDSPPHAKGGFHPETVRTALEALARIEELEAQLAQEEAPQHGNLGGPCTAIVQGGGTCGKPATKVNQGCAMCEECDEFFTRVEEEAGAPAVSQILVKALRRIADRGDCECQHDSEDCCNNCPPGDYVCPECIAEVALKNYTGGLNGKG